MFSTPILYIVFNRIDTVIKTFERIRQVQPLDLYIAADGPRNDAEKEKCQEVRKYILSHADWKCNVHTLFHENNLGCGKGVSSAISWFFTNVRMGIILEDDCLPDMTFFPYCEELLTRYENQSDVMHIAGYTPLNPSNVQNKESYYFSRMQFCWGWATWARAWKSFDFDINENYKKVLKSNGYFKNPLVRYKWKSIFSMMRKHEIDTWDYQWAYKIFEKDGLCIIPNINLVQNIGFDFGTHFTGSNLTIENSPAFSIVFPLVHPIQAILSSTEDKRFQNMDAKEFKNFLILNSYSVLKKLKIYNILQSFKK